MNFGSLRDFFNAIPKLESYLETMDQVLISDEKQSDSEDFNARVRFHKELSQDPDGEYAQNVQQYLKRKNSDIPSQFSFAKDAILMYRILSNFEPKYQEALQDRQFVI